MLQLCVWRRDEGQVVGSSETASRQMHAFLWQDGVMIDLGTLGGGDSRAFGLNNQGQIVGESDIGRGRESRRSLAGLVR